MNATQQHKKGPVLSLLKVTFKKNHNQLYQVRSDLETKEAAWVYSHDGMRVAFSGVPALARHCSGSVHWLLALFATIANRQLFLTSSDKRLTKSLGKITR